MQNVGNRTVVYLADTEAPGTLVEREVRLGETTGDDVEVVAGIHSGDLVVTAGSFSLRAERDRLGLRTSKAVATEGTRTERTQPNAAGTPNQSETQTAKISVTEQGYEPATITVKAGHPTKLTFVRTSDRYVGLKSCSRR